jgi:hypothetical protein
VRTDAGRRVVGLWLGERAGLRRAAALLFQVAFPHDELAPLGDPARETPERAALLLFAQHPFDIVVRFLGFVRRRPLIDRLLERGSAEHQKAAIETGAHRLPHFRDLSGIVRPLVVQVYRQLGVRPVEYLRFAVKFSLLQTVDCEEDRRQRDKNETKYCQKYVHISALSDGRFDFVKRGWRYRQDLSADRLRPNPRQAHWFSVSTHSAIDELLVLHWAGRGAIVDLRRLTPESLQLGNELAAAGASR